MDPSQPRPPGERAPENPSLEDPGELELAIFDLLRVAMLWNEDKFASLESEIGESHRAFLDSFLELVAKHRGTKLPLGRDGANILRAGDLRARGMVDSIAVALKQYQADVKPVGPRQKEEAPEVAPDAVSSQPKRRHRRKKAEESPPSPKEVMEVEAAAASAARRRIGIALLGAQVPRSETAIAKLWERLSRSNQDVATELKPGAWVTRLGGAREAAREMIAIITGASASHIRAVLPIAEAHPHLRKSSVEELIRELAWTPTWPRTIAYGLKVLGFSDRTIRYMSRLSPMFTPQRRDGLRGLLDERRIAYEEALHPSEPWMMADLSARELNEMAALELEGPEQEARLEELREEDQRALDELVGSEEG